MTKIKKITENINLPLFYNGITKPKEDNISLFPTDNEDVSPILEDIFRYERIQDGKNFLYKASDGQNYNLKELILTRISCMTDELSRNRNQKNSPVQEWNNLFIKNTKNKKEVEKLIKTLEKSWDDVNKSNNLKQIFESQLGLKYTNENAEKFLKGELDLILEKDYHKVTGDYPEEVSAVPYTDESCISSGRKTRLNSTRKNLKPEEQIKYNKINQLLGRDYQNKLKAALESGKLLLADSEDKSSVLDNLYKIITNPRAKEVNRITILKECISILDNPYIITQLAEDIPEPFIDKFVPQVTDLKDEKEARDFLTEREPGTCVAASIEYYMASEHTAEFFRIIEGITSDKKEVKKVTDGNKCNLTYDVIEFFNTQYETKDGFFNITLKADDAAYMLTDMQKKFQDEDERTSVDILFQSLVFQLAIGNTYNSVSDTHKGLFAGPGEGLSDNEENYALKILTGNNVVNKIYKKLDGSGRLESVNNTNQEISDDIDKALNSGKSIIMGIYCSFDPEKELYLEGHEITIVGKTTSIDGTELYICKDSDEEYSRPITISKEFLLNHALSSNIED